MSNIILPRIGQREQEESNEYKNIHRKRISGPNVPPAASRQKKYSVLAVDGLEKRTTVLPNIAVSGLKNENLSNEELSKDDDNIDKQRNINVESNFKFPAEIHYGYEQIPEDDTNLTDLMIEGVAKTKKKTDTCQQKHLIVKERLDVLYPVPSSSSSYESLDAKLVDWNDFSDKKKLDKNLDKVLSCKKAVLHFDVAKVDYIPGIVAIPVFHCLRCAELWTKTEKVLFECKEEVNPTRGIPIAVDEKSLHFIQNPQTQFIQIRGRKTDIKKSYGRTYKKTLSVADNLASVSSDIASGVNIISRQSKSKASMNSKTSSVLSSVEKDSQESIKCTRKYGGLNPSEAALIVKESDMMVNAGDSGYYGDTLKRLKDKRENPQVKHNQDELHHHQSSSPKRNTDGNEYVSMHNTKVQSSENDQTTLEKNRKIKSKTTQSFHNPQKSRKTKQNQQNEDNSNSRFVNNDLRQEAISKVELTIDNGLMGSNEGDHLSNVTLLNQGSAIKITIENLTLPENDVSGEIVNQEDSLKIGNENVINDKPHSKEMSAVMNVEKEIPLGMKSVESTSVTNSIVPSIVIEGESNEKEGNILGNINSRKSLTKRPSYVDVVFDPNVVQPTNELKLKSSGKIIKNKQKANRLAANDKNPGVWNKTGVPEKRNKSLGQHIMATTDGGGIKQITDETMKTNDQQQFIKRRTSIPTSNNDQQYIMQGGGPQIQPKDQQKMNKSVILQSKSEKNATVTTKSENNNTSNSFDKSNFDKGSTKTNNSFDKGRTISSMTNKSSAIITEKEKADKLTNAKNQINNNQSSNNEPQMKQRFRSRKQNEKSPKSKKDGKNNYELPPVERLKTKQDSSEEIIAFKVESFHAPSSLTKVIKNTQKVETIPSIEKKNALPSPYMNVVPPINNNEFQVNSGTKSKGNLTVKNRSSKASMNVLYHQTPGLLSHNKVCNTNSRSMVKPSIGKLLRSRARNTPSPILHRESLLSELACLQMRRFTNNFTFSFYELPGQYAEENRKVKNRILKKSKKK